MFLSSCSCWWITMEGSSESGWRTSNSSRGLNSSAASDRNTRVVRDSSSGFVSVRNGRDADVFSQAECIKMQVGSSGACEDEVAVDPVVRSIEWNDVSLRQWLDNLERSVDELECLHIFMQIVEIVDLAHSRGIVVHNVRPSCFVISSLNRVSFIESASSSDSGSDSFEDGSDSQTAEFNGSSPHVPHDSHQQRNQLGAENSQVQSDPANAAQIVSDRSYLQSSSVHATHVSLEEGSNVEQAEEKKHSFPMKRVLLMETSWYTSPEEVAGTPSSCASDIYRLGVLLFELFCTFSSPEEKSSTMSSLRHRVLPPQLLLKWPKEASFCLWLLHPQPSNRPKMGELLKSEFLNEPRENFEEREAAIEHRERIEEQELLLEFLFQMQQRKQEVADNMQDSISFLTSDIEEVTMMQATLRKKGPKDAVDIDDYRSSGPRKRFRPSGLQIQNPEESDGHMHEGQKPEGPAKNLGSVLSKDSRLMKNFKKLESTYFLTRRGGTIKLSGKPLCKHSTSSDGKGSIIVTERSSINNFPLKERRSKGRQHGWINSFLEGLCKYMSFSNLKVKADLKQGDLLNSSNLVCSLGFDRDGEFFATAGVNKKIKVFEYETVLNEDRDIHYPVVEMASKSKLSSICWNGYIKSQIASSNFVGVVQVWDVSRSEVFMEMREHESRVWSVDFSSADPKMLASGSDDGSVKLWNINQEASVGTIKTKANVCCVQFPFDSGRSLAFGSADHRIYYYDLRNSKTPLCTLMGHNKTVSYVKFVDSTSLVSASTDNTLKLWDLSMSTSQVIDSPLQSFTGHVNVKNFVGLSVSEGYIATGSETNEVFIYHKAFPMPALSFKFGNSDPLSGNEVVDPAQFISSVCWRAQSSTLVAANSTGNIKVLEMV